MLFWPCKPKTVYPTGITDRQMTSQRDCMCPSDCSLSARWSWQLVQHRTTCLCNLNVSLALVQPFMRWSLIFSADIIQAKFKLSVQLLLQYNSITHVMQLNILNSRLWKTVNVDLRKCHFWSVLNYCSEQRQTIQHILIHKSILGKKKKSYYNSTVIWLRAEGK